MAFLLLLFVAVVVAAAVGVGVGVGVVAAIASLWHCQLLLLSKYKPAKSNMRLG